MTPLRLKFKLVGLKVHEDLLQMAQVAVKTRGEHNHIVKCRVVFRLLCPNRLHCYLYHCRLWASQHQLTQSLHIVGSHLNHSCQWLTLGKLDRERVRVAQANCESPLTQPSRSPCHLPFMVSIIEIFHHN
ncbi:hypothetical protein AOLI_G00188170 [Acnodon oligacanthus]